MNEKKQSKLLEMLAQVAPLIQQLVPLDCMIGVTDKEKFLRYLPAEDVDLKCEDEIIPEGDAIYIAVNSEKVVSVEVPKESFGIPFKATGVPVRDEDGNVIGGLGLGVSLKNQEFLFETAESFVATSEEITAMTEELAASAQELANEMESLNTLQKELIEQVNKTEIMLKFINKVASNSNLLGLNASIEAARAGKQGRGFEVVANEIRKMADNSASSVEEIKETIELIQQKVMMISNTTENITGVTQRQATASEEIAASIQQLSSSAEEIEKIARII